MTRASLLDSLHVTATLKVDSAALPALTADADISGAQFQAVMTELLQSPVTVDDVVQMSCNDVLPAAVALAHEFAAGEAVGWNFSAPWLDPATLVVTNPTAVELPGQAAGVAVPAAQAVIQASAAAEQSARDAMLSVTGDLERSASADPVRRTLSEFTLPGMPPNAGAQLLGSQTDQPGGHVLPTQIATTAGEPKVPDTLAGITASAVGSDLKATETEPRATRPETWGRLEHPVGTQLWRQELGTRLIWMRERGEQAATLRLSPEHLGPLEVRIAVRDGETTLWFAAAHPDTRQALEQALPRLREQFSLAGLALGQSWVSQDQQPGAFDRNAPMPGTPQANADRIEDIAEPTARRTVEITGLIDTFV